MLDWDANVNPRVRREQPRTSRSRSKPVRGDRAPTATARSGSPTARRYYSAKELTVLPRRTVTIKDAAAYGLILTRATARSASMQVSTPSMIRFGQMTEDELFVTAAAAREGVRIENRSDTDPLVMLKHFGPGNPDAEAAAGHETRSFEAGRQLDSSNKRRAEIDPVWELVQSPRWR